MSDRSPWQLSGWDHKLHAFPELGEIASEAVCRHTALTSKLISWGQPGTEGAEWCEPCLTKVREALARNPRDMRWGE